MRWGIGNEDDHLGRILSPVQIRQCRRKTGRDRLGSITATSSYGRHQLHFQLAGTGDWSSPMRPLRYSCTFGISDENGWHL